MKGAKFVNYLVKLARARARKTKFTQKLSITAQTQRMAGWSRLVENGWILKHLGNVHKVLDIGSTGSLLPIQLAGMGYDVYSVDPRSYVEYHGLTHPNMKFIRGDMRFAMFRAESFEAVTAVGTIEHMGTRDYDNPILEQEGDRKAAIETARILKKEGQFIFTIPYRRKIVIRTRRRVAEVIRKGGIIARKVVPQPSPLRAYNEKTIRKRLLGGYFDVEKEEYFSLRGGFWYPTALEEMKNVKEGLVCIVAKKR